MAERNVGELRESERYHGDPKTREGARARKFLDGALTSDSDYMKDAVKDTGRILQRAGQRNINSVANRATKRKTTRGGGR